MIPFRKLTKRSKTKTNKISEQMMIGIINTPPRRSRSVKRVAETTGGATVERTGSDTSAVPSVTVIGVESLNEDDVTAGVETVFGVSKPFWTGFENVLKF